MIAGETYTMSCLARGYGILRFQYGSNALGFYQGYANVDSTEWKPYSWTFVYEGDESTIFYLGGNLTRLTGTVQSCAFKLEEGDKATPWCLNEMDVRHAGDRSLIQTIQTEELSNLGFGSGFLLDNLETIALNQYVELPEASEGLMYSLSFYMKIDTEIAGVTAGLRVYEDDVVTYTIGHDDATLVPEGGFRKYSLVFNPTTTNTKVELFVDNGFDTTVTISGIMYNIGNLPLKWQPFPSEIYNTNVKIDINGITVKNNQTDGYTLITPSEFSGYARVDGDMERIFTLNGEVTEVKMLKAEQRITMEPIVILAMDNVANRGWAFVSSTGM